MSLKEKDLESADLESPRDSSPAEAGQVLHVNNADAALAFLNDESTGREMTAEDEKKLVRKIDWMIMPLMWSCYCLQYLDKTLSENTFDVWELDS